MKMIIKNTLKGTLFCVILIFLITACCWAILPQEITQKYGIMRTGKYDILKEAENTIDAVAIGDSLIFTGISPMEIWHDYGYTMFDSAENAQLMSQAYGHLEAAIESQHPKVVFLEAGVLFRDIKNKKWYPINDDELLLKIPTTRYHNNWKKTLLNSLNNGNVNFEWLNYTKGYRYIKTVVPAPKIDYMKDNGIKIPVPEDNIEYLEKFINLCDKNDTRLVIISTPDMKLWNYAKHVSTEKLAKEYDLEFIDLNVDNQLNIDWDTETKDGGGHLNYKGSLKLSKFIGDYLQSSNLLVDHRGDKVYSSWDRCYSIYESKK